MPPPQHLRPRSGPDLRVVTLAGAVLVLAVIVAAGRVGLTVASAGADSSPASAVSPASRATVDGVSGPTTVPLRLRSYEVEYGADPDQRVRVDVPGVPSPVVVYVHGGGWTERRSVDLLPAAATTSLLRDGWAVARVSFRLAADDVSASDQVDDLHDALDVVRSLTQTAGLSGRTVLVGHSSGAHLALLLAFRDDPTIEHVIGVGGIYDFADDVQENPLVAHSLPAALGCDPARCTTARLDELTPSTWLDHATGVRLTLIHGARDPIAPIDGARRLLLAATDAGMRADLVVVPGAGHDVAEASDAVLRSLVR